MVRGLTKRFGGVVANDAIDFVMGVTGVHAVIGPNGTGKTTFIAQLCGELMPDAGSVRFAGADITRWPAYRRPRTGSTSGNTRTARRTTPSAARRSEAGRVPVLAGI